MEDITLYNAYYDKNTEKTLYLKTYLYGVEWQGGNIIAIKDKGIVSADKTEIFVPINATSDKEGYIKPKEYLRLSLDEAKKHFTLRSKDKIVKGIVDFEVTGEKGHTIKDLENEYDDVITITNIMTYDFGSFNMQHWEIVGV